jgi:hypothetical protein
MLRQGGDERRLRVWKTRWFGRFARKEGISDALLCEAVARAERGLIDADLGGGVIKQRVARSGQGRSGGFRTIVLYRAAERSVFAYGFAKSRKADLTEDELAVYRRLAKLYLGIGTLEFEKLVAAEMLTEVTCDGGKEEEISQ